MHARTGEQELGSHFLQATYRALRSFLGALVREIVLYPSIFLRTGKPCLLAFPSGDIMTGASYLRATTIASELRRRGWKTLVCPKHLSLDQRKRLARWLRPDVILIQMARHPLNVPQPFHPVPCVFDMDDADFQDAEQLPRILENMQGCVRVIAGSAYIAGWIRQHNQNVDVVWTATPIVSVPSKPQAERAQLVTWASSMPAEYPLEADFVVKVMALVAKARNGIRFRLYADSGSVAYKALVERFRAAGVAIETMPPLAYDEFLSTLEDVAVGLNPLVDTQGFSAGKSFGKLLAYLHAKVPSISHSNAEHPHFFTSGRNGYLAETPEHWAGIVIDLLNDAVTRQAIADIAHQDLIERLSLVPCTDRIEGILKQAISSADRPH
jgi:hypothetical protein